MSPPRGVLVVVDRKRAQSPPESPAGSRGQATVSVMNPDDTLQLPPPVRDFSNGRALHLSPLDAPRPRNCDSDRTAREPDRYARTSPRLSPLLWPDRGRSAQSGHTLRSGIVETASQTHRDRLAQSAPTIPFGSLYCTLLLVR